MTGAAAHKVEIDVINEIEEFLNWQPAIARCALSGSALYEHYEKDEVRCFLDFPEMKSFLTAWGYHGPSGRGVESDRQGITFSDGTDSVKMTWRQFYRIGKEHGLFAGRVIRDLEPARTIVFGLTPPARALCRRLYLPAAGGYGKVDFSQVPFWEDQPDAGRESRGGRGNRQVCGRGRGGAASRQDRRSS